MDENNQFISLPETSKLNFDQVLRILRSKDLQSDEVLKFEEEVKKHGSRLLDKTIDVPKVALATFPRSGNSLTRKLIEVVSGIATGANIMNFMHMNFSLGTQGFKGEQNT